MILRATLATILLIAIPASVPAQPAPTAAPAAKYSLDTPIESLVADEKAKAVLDSKLPGLTTNPSYEMFKGMGLNQLAGFSPDKLTPDRLKEVEAGLATIR